MSYLHIIKLKTYELIWNFFWHNFQLPQICIEDIVPDNFQAIPKITEKICIPPYQGEITLKDYSFLISLIKTLNPHIVLELGTAHGNTVANICAESDAKVFTVNALPEQMEGSLITFALPKNEIGYVYRKNGFEGRVVQIFENTKKINILDWLSPKSVDFAIIDACHDSEFVVNDFLKIYPSLSNHAIVLFHDTEPSLKYHFLDCYLGCMYLRKMGFNIKQIKESSWGYWSAENTFIQQLIMDKIKNMLFTGGGMLLYGNQEHYIKVLRWFASFLPGGKSERPENI